PEPGDSDESPPQAEPRMGEAGFASSIFTDLDEPAAADDVPAGPFKSRLLNELTREAASAQPEPVIDVLLDEFPLPGDRRIPDRDAEKDQ
ncbi:MAG: hypothetical protein M3Y37_00865, partial [Chloroflexota bacterium]|nr:hypothetical protein [Chloroflexota bacterium]